MGTAVDVATAPDASSEIETLMSGKVTRFLPSPHRLAALVVALLIGPLAAVYALTLGFWQITLVLALLFAAGLFSLQWVEITDDSLVSRRVIGEDSSVKFVDIHDVTLGMSRRGRNKWWYPTLTLTDGTTSHLLELTSKSGRWTRVRIDDLIDTASKRVRILTAINPNLFGVPEVEVPKNNSVASGYAEFRAEQEQLAVAPSAADELVPTLAPPEPGPYGDSRPAEPETGSLLDPSPEVFMPRTADFIEPAPVAPPVPVEAPAVQPSAPAVVSRVEPVSQVPATQVPGSYVPVADDDAWTSGADIAARANHAAQIEDDDGWTSAMPSQQPAQRQPQLPPAQVQPQQPHASPPSRDAVPSAQPQLTIFGTKKPTITSLFGSSVQQQSEPATPAAEPEQRLTSLFNQAA